MKASIPQPLPFWQTALSTKMQAFQQSDAGCVFRRAPGIDPMKIQRHKAIRQHPFQRLAHMAAMLPVRMQRIPHLHRMETALVVKVDPSDHTL